MNAKLLVNRWSEHPLYAKELHALVDEVEIQDRFHQQLTFGTGGMRGRLGAGTNRMNIHTIRLVAEGLARQIVAEGEIAKVRGVVIAYDTRHFSKQFAYETAGVLATHGIQSYVFKESRPTPMLSFAVRYLAAYAGVVITASHNPKQYNGFKVYGDDGAQLTPQFADNIVAHMKAVDSIFDIPSLSKGELLESGICMEILERLDDAYAQGLHNLQSIKQINKDLVIVYTPLHGAGLDPTVRGFKDFGFSHVYIVEQQAIQDGDFATVAFPNPEEPDAFRMAVELGKKVGAEILLATDPDADRLGVAVLVQGEYQLLTGNQLGAMVLHYLLQTMPIPANAAMIKTIVTSEFGTAIADAFGVATVNTLTGFKYIAEKIAEWELSKEFTFLFGYEESYGYLAGDFVRDKDAVQMALLSAEMAAFYKAQGKTLCDVLSELYEQFGAYKEALVSLTLDGIEGQKKIASILQSIRKNPPSSLANLKVLKVEDYTQGGVNGLPKADVVKFILEEDSWICIRPSGTEPKCKFYIGVKQPTQEQSSSLIERLKEAIKILY